VIEAATLANVMDQVATRARSDGEALVGHLRGSFPGLHFTVCGEDDIPVRMHAAAGNAFCNLYYVSTGEHCLSLTDDAEAATGLVVALCDDETD